MPDSVAIDGRRRPRRDSAEGYQKGSDYKINEEKNICWVDNEDFGDFAEVFLSAVPARGGCDRWNADSGRR